MSDTNLPPSFKACATCAFWGGTRSASPRRSLAVFESDQRGECLGGGFNRASMAPLSSCGKWGTWSGLRD